MAIRFVIDEDMHRSVAQALADLEYRAIDIRDHGLRGKPDDAIFRFAQRRHAVLLSADLGFSNILRFPLGSHYGIVIVRFPNELPTDRINTELKKSLRGLTDRDFNSRVT